jgi:hypothetical protein
MKNLIKKTYRFDYLGYNKQSGINVEIYRDNFNRLELIKLWQLKLIDKILELDREVNKISRDHIEVFVNPNYFNIFKNDLNLNLHKYKTCYRYGNFNNSIDFILKDDIECIAIDGYEIIIDGYEIIIDVVFDDLKNRTNECSECDMMAQINGIVLKNVRNVEKILRY